MAEKAFVEAPQTTESKSFNWPKIILAAVLGFGLLASAAYAGYWYGSRQVQTVEKPTPISQPTITPTPTLIPTLESTPTPTQPVTDPTAGWKTYTNIEGGYSLRYAPNLEVTQETSHSTLFNVKQTQPGPPGFPSLYVSVIPDGFTNEDSSVYNFMPEATITSFFEANVGEVEETRAGEMYSEFWTYKKLPSVVVAGREGAVVENNKVWEGGNNWKDRRVFVKEKGFIYMIGAYYQTSEELNNFNQILSTFKFLD